MDDDWTADIDAELQSSGLAPALVLVPPPEVGPPLRRVLDGEHPSAEHATLAAPDAFTEMTLKYPGVPRARKRAAVPLEAAAGTTLSSQQAARRGRPGTSSATCGPTVA